jgi:hypothetical protein
MGVLLNTPSIGVGKTFFDMDGLHKVFNYNSNLG